MDAFKASTSYPNIRKHPYTLADLGDHVIEINEKYYDVNNKGWKLAELFNNDEWNNRVDFKFNNQFGSETLDFFAEYLYSLTLLTARRTLECMRDWRVSADLIIKLVCESLCNFTNLDRKEIDALIRDYIDVNRLARQMQFYLTPEHLSAIEKNAIPYDIYGFKVKVDSYTVKKEHARQKKNDFDLGPFGGNNPLTELDKLLNVYVQLVGCFRSLQLKNLKTSEDKATSSQIMNSRELIFKPKKLSRMNNGDLTSVIPNKKLRQ